MLAKHMMDWKIHYLDGQDMNTYSDAHEHMPILLEEIISPTFWDIMSRRIVGSLLGRLPTSLYACMACTLGQLLQKFTPFSIS
jgi:hypothetical protein